MAEFSFLTSFFPVPAVKLISEAHFSSPFRENDSAILKVRSFGQLILLSWFPCFSLISLYQCAHFLTELLVTQVHQLSPQLFEVFSHFIFLLFLLLPVLTVNWIPLTPFLSTLSQVHLFLAVNSNLCPTLTQTYSNLFLWAYFFWELGLKFLYLVDLMHFKFTIPVVLCSSKNIRTSNSMDHGYKSVFINK